MHGPRALRLRRRRPRPPPPPPPALLSTARGRNLLQSSFRLRRLPERRRLARLDPRQRDLRRLARSSPRAAFAPPPPPAPPPRAPSDSLRFRDRPSLRGRRGRRVSRHRRGLGRPLLKRRVRAFEASPPPRSPARPPPPPMRERRAIRATRRRLLLRRQRSRLRRGRLRRRFGLRHLGASHLPRGEPPSTVPRPAPPSAARTPACRLARAHLARPGSRGVRARFLQAGFGLRPRRCLARGLLRRILRLLPAALGLGGLGLGLGRLATAAASASCDAANARCFASAVASAAVAPSRLGPAQGPPAPPSAVASVFVSRPTPASSPPTSSADANASFIPAAPWPGAPRSPPPAPHLRRRRNRQPEPRRLRLRLLLVALRRARAARSAAVIADGGGDPFLRGAARRPSCGGLADSRASPPPASPPPPSLCAVSSSTPSTPRWPPPAQLARLPRWRTSPGAPPSRPPVPMLLGCARAARALHLHPRRRGAGRSAGAVAAPSFCLATAACVSFMPSRRALPGFLSASSCWVSPAGSTGTLGRCCSVVRQPLHVLPSAPLVAGPPPDGVAGFETTVPGGGSRLASPWSYSSLLERCTATRQPAAAASCPSRPQQARCGTVPQPTQRRHTRLATGA